MFELCRRLAWRVVALDPNVVMVAPTPMAGDPIPARAVVPVPLSMSVVRSIVNVDVDPQRFGALRQYRSRAGKRGQQNSYFVFHKSYSLNRFKARIDGIMQEIRYEAFIALEPTPRPTPALGRPICRVRESNPEGVPPLLLPEY